MLTKPVALLRWLLLLGALPRLLLPAVWVLLPYTWSCICIAVLWCERRGHVRSWTQRASRRLGVRGAAGVWTLAHDAWQLLVYCQRGG